MLLTCRDGRFVLFNNSLFFYNNLYYLLYLNFKHRCCKVAPNTVGYSNTKPFFGEETRNELHFIKGHGESAKI